MKTVYIMLLWIFGALLVLALIVIIIGNSVSQPGYTGPESDHFNGTTFINPGNVKAKGGFEVLKWMFNRDQGTWTERLESEVEFGAKPVARISDSLVVTYVNHATFLIQTDSLNILTDPVWSKRVSPFSFAGPKRMRPPGIRFEDLPDIDLIILSHNHYDHLDIKTLKKLNEKFNPLFVVPLGVDLYLNQEGIQNTHSMDWWDNHGIADSVSISAVPAQHFSARGMFDRDKTLWAGYVLSTSSGNIYFAGDTGYGAFFPEIGKRFAPVRLSLIPIGAYKPRWFMSPVHVDPVQALQVHKEVQSKLSIAMHYGTFPLADDGQIDPLNDFEEAEAVLENEESNFIILEEGSKMTVD